MLALGDIFTDDDLDLRLITGVNGSRMRLLTFSTLCFIRERPPVGLKLWVADIQFRTRWRAPQKSGTFIPLRMKEQRDT